MVESRSKLTNKKAELRRFLAKLRFDFFTRERLVVLIALAFCATWTWRGISSMSRNWELEQRLQSRQHELALLRLEVETLELENQYYASEEYQELAARAKKNKMFAGETMVYLPENSLAARTKYPATTAATAPAESTRSNFQQWLSFLFGA